MFNALDMHCDTLWKAFERHVNDFENADILDMPGCAIDFNRLAEAGYAAQFFAVYLPPRAEFSKQFGSDSVTDEDYIYACCKIMENSLARTDKVLQAKTADDIRRNLAAGKASAVLTMEDGRAVDYKMENIKRFYDLGVRACSLTWNGANCLGNPNSKDPELMKLGLTDFGKEAIQYMQELGMLVDVSHLSDGGFYDVASICKKPFIASHSNARALAPHQRNLTDDMLKILGNAGGVTGINFCGPFLNADAASPQSTAKRMAEHMMHIANVAGMDAVALGSDLDGTIGELEIDECTKMYLLADALKAEGFTEAQIDKAFSGNVLRVMDEAVK